jgi:hypothetical protein
MVSLLIFCILVIPFVYLYGILTLFLVRILFHISAQESSPEFSFSCLLGLATVTSLASLLSLFMNISFTALAILLLVAVIPTLLFKPIRIDFSSSFPWPRARPTFFSVVLAAFLVISIMEISTHRPSNPDSGIYHAQMIRWIETYPAVPGLGNLHGRLAFNSSWLVANALFSFSFLNIQSFHLLPALLLVIALYESLRGFALWKRRPFHYTAILRILFIPMVFYLWASEISSPGTDFPAAIFFWLIFLFWLDSDYKLRKPINMTQAGVFVLSIFAFTVKLTVFPVLIFALLVLIKVIFDRRTLPGYLVTGFGVLAPWLARNLVISGYLVYPVPVLDLFHFDWKMPIKAVNDERDAILAWGRLPRQNIARTMQMDVRHWMPMWFANLTSNQKGIVALALISPLGMGLSWMLARWRRKPTFSGAKAVWITFAIMYAGFFYWLFSAPAIRFGYTFLVPLILLPISYFGWSLMRERYQTTPIFLNVLLLGLIGFQALFLYQSFDRSTFLQRLVLPTDYPRLPTVPCELANTTVLCAAEESWSECWYSPFPCIPYARPDVEMRGTDYRQGFRAIEPGSAFLRENEEVSFLR